MDKKDEFSKFIGKKVFIVLKTGMLYNGLIKETTSDFIFLSDKFNKPVVININDISSLEEKD